MKFVFLCILKKVPEMDDDFLAKMIGISLSMVSAFAVGVKFLMNRLPNASEVQVSLFSSIRTLKCISSAFLNFPLMIFTINFVEAERIVKN